MYERTFCTQCKRYTVHKLLKDGSFWCVHHDRRKEERRAGYSERTLASEFPDVFRAYIQDQGA